MQDNSKIDNSKAYESITYEFDSNNIRINFSSESQSIWVTCQNMADLFGVNVTTIKEHLKNIYDDDELEQISTSRKFLLVRNEDGRSVSREVNHYNLDVILSVGYRTNAKRAIKFRQWATQILKTYLEQGYVINEKALRDSPEQLNKLAAEVRALRSSEKQVYAKVRECFKISASDYDQSSNEVKYFYALLQDKFHHAVTGMTSSKLIMDRADHHEDKMGLKSTKNDKPTKAEIKIGKNYLNPDELYRLHLLSEQFLLFAESTALAKKKMTMLSLKDQLDRLLTLNDYPVFSGYTDYIKDEAIRHAEQEYSLYQKRIKIQSLGYEYNEDALANGEYNELLSIE